MSQIARRVAEILAAPKTDGVPHKDLEQGDFGIICDAARYCRAMSLPDHTLDNQIATAAQAAVDAFDQARL